MTKTSKKHDQPCFNLKIEKDLPNTTKITTKTVKKHDQPCLNLKIEKDLPNETQVLPPQNQK